MSSVQSSPVPSDIDSRAYRNVVSKFATGVTVIATGEDESLHVMTANGVTSLSLEPLLFLVCIGKKTHMAERIEQTQGFSINILHQDQQDLSIYFAGGWQAKTPPLFTFSTWAGGPLLTGCLAALGCELYDTLEGGDHWIYLGKVTSLYESDQVDNSPLLYYQGRYRGLTED